MNGKKYKMETIVIKDQKKLFEGWKKLGENYSPSLYQRIDNYDQFIEKLFQYAENYALVEDEVLMGMISFYANDIIREKAYITEIIVDQQFQRMGIGKKLIDICISESKKKGMNGIRLEVKKNNQGAIKFYERMGFRYESDKSMIAIYMYCDI